MIGTGEGDLMVIKGPQEPLSRNRFRRVDRIVIRHPPQHAAAIDVVVAAEGDQEPGAPAYSSPASSARTDIDMSVSRVATPRSAKSRHSVG
ncbi:MAG: hypothetical protein QOH57_4597 [Mycobacterium sp.]|nr:hypothetical protein [Mycobacterium sp.]